MLTHLLHSFPSLNSTETLILTEETLQTSCLSYLFVYKCTIKCINKILLQKLRIKKKEICLKSQSLDNHLMTRFGAKMGKPESFICFRQRWHLAKQHSPQTKHTEYSLKKFQSESVAVTTTVIEGLSMCYPG